MEPSLAVRDAAPATVPVAFPGSVPLDRRVATLGLLAAAGSAACGADSAPASASGSAPAGANSHGPRLPAVYLPHGGGPWPFVDIGMPRSEVNAMSEYLRTLAHLAPSPPRALLVITAHWEAPEVTVSTGERPGMLFDYYGFPDAAYLLSWPAPGHPSVAERARELLRAAGIESRADAERGFDHGTFIPMMVAFPEANVPTVQVSLRAGLHPAEHLAIGRALAPLRDEGVLVLGSGMSYHNLRGFRDPRARAHAEEFDEWLRAAAEAEPASRDDLLTSWTTAPRARDVHPREEHLLPLMVIAGAAGSDRGRRAWAGSMLGVRVSGHQFG
jgi:aromatic ring-opening dioxygenase catalytic subunit (LigB family)